MIDPFYIFLIVCALIIFGIAGSFFYAGYKRKKEIISSLNFVLYEITFPREKPKEAEKDFKELIAPMEQLYSGMSGGDSYFVFEIGLPATGKEIVFYAAVERSRGLLFEKQVQGLFPQASLKIKKDDYNIFKPQGFSLGSFAKLKRENILPIKTYDKFESDPLQVIINTFSKLRLEGEGAALQIVVSPAGEGVIKKSKTVAIEARKGKSLTKILYDYEHIGKGVMREAWNLIFGYSGPKKDDQKPMDEELVKLLEMKASRMMARANIRLLASSENKEKTESILSELESAFLQFGEAQGNRFEFVRPKAKKLKELFYNFSFRMPDIKNAFIFNTAELASVFHFPLGIVAGAASQLKQAKTKEAPVPLNLPIEGILLGQNIYRGETTKVYMAENDRRRHFYIIGQTGTGKSVLLKNMIIQDIEAGKGVCFIDPHGSDLQDILSRIPASRVDDVIYFNPGDVSRPMGLNMLEYDSRYPEQKTFIVNELLGIFNKLFDMKVAGGPAFEQYFRNATLLVMDDPESGNTLLEVARIFTDKDFRQYKISKCKNPIVNTFWRELAEKSTGEQSLQNFGPYITNKFDNFISNEIMRPIISQEKSAFNFRQAMDEGKILLVNLSKGRLGDLNANLLGLIIVGRLLMASLSRADMPEEQRRDFYLYIDEFQNVTTDSIATILSEARKYKLNLTIAHQFIGQLAEEIKKAVFGNVGSMAAFRVGAEDGEFLEKQFEPVFNSYDLINIDNFHAYLKILVNGQVSRPFSIQTMIFSKGDLATGEKIAQISSLKYGRQREEIEAEINQRYSK